MLSSEEKISLELADFYGKILQTVEIQTYAESLHQYCYVVTQKLYETELRGTCKEKQKWELVYGKSFLYHFMTIV